MTSGPISNILEAMPVLELDRPVPVAVGYALTSDPQW
jgi:hypothetical protein